MTDPGGVLSVSEANVTIGSATKGIGSLRKRPGLDQDGWFRLGLRVVAILVVGPRAVDDRRHLLADGADLAAVRCRRLHHRDQVGAVVHHLRRMAVHLWNGPHFADRDADRRPDRRPDRPAHHGDPARLGLGVASQWQWTPSQRSRRSSTGCGASSSSYRSFGRSNRRSQVRSGSTSHSCRGRHLGRAISPRA